MRYKVYVVHVPPTDSGCRDQLRNAINFASAAQDNHLRALVFALIAGQYVHTSAEHAETLLSTAEQIAAGLGAQPKTVTGSPGKKVFPNRTRSVPATGGIGNAHLRMWIAERSLGLFINDLLIYDFLMSFQS